MYCAVRRARAWRLTKELAPHTLPRTSGHASETKGAMRTAWKPGLVGWTPKMCFERKAVAPLLHGWQSEGLVGGFCPARSRSAT